MVRYSSKEEAAKAQKSLHMYVPRAWQPGCSPAGLGLGCSGHVPGLPWPSAAGRRAQSLGSGAGHPKCRQGRLFPRPRSWACRRPRSVCPCPDFPFLRGHQSEWAGRTLGSHSAGVVSLKTTLRYSRARGTGGWGLSTWFGGGTIHPVTAAEWPWPCPPPGKAPGEWAQSPVTERRHLSSPGQWRACSPLMSPAGLSSGPYSPLSPH